VLVGLPIVAGPILLITCLDHGTRFGAAAASSALLGLLTLALFAVVFAWCARRLGWLGSLAVAWSACLIADLALARLTVPPVVGFVLVLAAMWAAARAMPPDAGAWDSRPVVAWPWWDLPGRAAATALLVVVVTTLAGALGPGLTGVLAPFPIASSVVAAFALAQRGSAETARLLRGVLAGLLGFASFCLLVSLLVVPLGTAAAFGIASAATVVIQLAWQWLLRRRPNGDGRALRR
jgi:hypothetical protein